jgi:bile acid-coenzyme A ligase
LADEAVRMSHGSRLAELARHVERPGLIFAGADGSEEVWTFAMLESTSNRLARLLEANGVGEETVVAMAIANSPELVMLCYATWKLGACVLPLNPRAPAQDLEGMLEAAASSGHPLAMIGNPIKGDVINLDNVDDFSDEPLPDRISQPGKAIGSGGSTGRSKIIVDPRPWVGVVSPEGSIDNFGRRPEHVVLIGGPMYHNGPFGPLFAGLFDGATVVLMERYDAARAVDLIERHRINWTFMVPTQMARIARLPGIESRDLSSLAGLYHAGSFCPEWLKRRWIDLIGAKPLLEVYGCAEGIGVTFIWGEEWLAHPGSVGKAESIDLRIQNADGNPLPPGEVGEVFMRWKGAGDVGFLVADLDPTDVYEYWGSPRMKTTADGFSSAGDLGWLDADGYLYLADRRQDLIISGGANVYPAEVEMLISSHPAVADVVVLGLPDEDWGQRVHAVVQLAQPWSDRESDLAALCREKLAPAKRPKSFEFVDVMPRDESGKVRRSLMREQRSETDSAAAG